MEKIDKLLIADELLETAIDCYLDQNKYLSALHLSGAAQEIYGKWIRSNNGQDFSTLMLNEYEKQLGVKIDRKVLKKSDKHAKNTIKHLDSKSDRFAQLNPKLDAFMQISEAVTDYMLLRRYETENITRFKNYLISTKENGL
ncbi:hypothetical protein [Vibrio cholerae]|uniref:hypothetical protein n=1 Tax=Vibrio cholerae TaxID=666 RepID=UPI0011EE87B9|nr:hypothetical protein [Vibrio cholerae]ELT7571700.1 hypothetical protein [Vibrio cholerae]TYW39955.1 hypothetical protein FY556_17885 [Vibrio cholerae]TYW48290.1 hypothetical protein FY558_18250 [Vibrio cholerae]HDI3224331.1 hypothetical protein [Vibrio cholerae]